MSGVCTCGITAMADVPCNVHGPRSAPGYRVAFFDREGTEVRIAEHSTLSRAAQDARLSVNDLDGPFRAVIVDSTGRRLWQTDKHKSSLPDDVQ